MFSIVCFKLFLVTDNRVFLDIHSVILVMENPDKEGADACSACNTGVHPGQFGIHCDGHERECEEGGDAVGEQEKGHDNRLHGLRSLLVSVFETCDGGKDFRKGDKDI